MIEGIENQKKPKLADEQQRVVIVGAGLAGLAAASALAGRGLKVDLIESRRQCGGRAASFEDSEDGSLVDACQHVAMGCCTNFLDLCERTGLGHYLRRDRTLWFIGPDGKRSACTPAGGVPAPFHLVPLLFGMKHFSFLEKAALSWGMVRLAVRPKTWNGDSEITAAQWLYSRQPERVIQLFWQPVIESALGESIDFVGISAVRKVVIDGFLAHPQAADLLVPTKPLGEIFGEKLVAWLDGHGVTVHSGRAVTGIQYDTSGKATGVLCGQDAVPADAVVLAVPWRAAKRLVPELLPPVDESFVGSPITAVHLWFDQKIFDLPHAVLVGRVSQWIFQGEEENGACGKKDLGTQSKDVEHHCQVVISASRGICGGDRSKLLEKVVNELQEIFPAARDARLIRSRIVTDPTAVLSVRPGIESVRPHSKTPVENLFLAGDWTQTGWPSTMEGAVRSGRQAASQFLEMAHMKNDCVVKDLHKNTFIRLLVG